MCMEDMAISMAITKRTENAIVAATAVPLVEADPTRYAIAINTDGVNTIWIDSDPGIVVGQGIPFKATDPPLLLCADEFGDWVRAGLWAIGVAAGPVHVGILITDFIPERFQAAKKYLEQFR